MSRRKDDLPVFIQLRGYVSAGSNRRDIVFYHDRSIAGTAVAVHISKREDDQVRPYIIAIKCSDIQSLSSNATSINGAGIDLSRRQNGTTISIQLNGSILAKRERGFSVFYRDDSGAGAAVAVHIRYSEGDFI